MYFALKIHFLVIYNLKEIFKYYKNQEISQNHDEGKIKQF